VVLRYSEPRFQWNIGDALNVYYYKWCITTCQIMWSNRGMEKIDDILKIGNFVKLAVFQWNGGHSVKMAQHSIKMALNLSKITLHSVKMADILLKWHGMCHKWQKTAAILTKLPIKVLLDWCHKL